MLGKALQDLVASGQLHRPLSHDTAVSAEALKTNLSRVRALWREEESTSLSP